MSEKVRPVSELRREPKRKQLKVMVPLIVVCRGNRSTQSEVNVPERHETSPGTTDGYGADQDILMRMSSPESRLDAKTVLLIE